MIRVGSGGVGGLTGVSGVGLDIQTADIELLIAAIQLNRASLIEDQMREQVQAVKSRNDALVRMNTLKSDLTTQKSYFSGKTANGELIEQPQYDVPNADKELFRRDYDKDPAGTLEKAKIGGYGEKFKQLAVLAQSMSDAGLDDATVGKVATGRITATELDAAITATTAKSDNLSSSQQIDMIRLQSLQQRRGEAFDLVTNIFKKMGDNRSNVVSNMR